MDIRRKPFQGILNIIEFNWHFYIIALICILSLYIGSLYVATTIYYIFTLIIFIIFGIISLSLLVSYYIYDYSRLYEFKWLENLENKKVINIHAGFDESSHIIKAKFPQINLTVCDFYDPKKHTEISIKRARTKYPPNKTNKIIKSNLLPFASNSVDHVLLIFAAHEIRDEKERRLFFEELNRIVKNNGSIILVEHLRDIKNFLAYNIGFLHFYSKKTWTKTLLGTGFKLHSENKLTPFVSHFKFVKDGNSF